jgi:tape measure domain-containing protein
MATIDDKVVAMSFDSSRFESGASRTLSMLEKLKQALNFSGAGKGLSDISASAGKVDLSHIGNAVDGIKNKFSMLSVAAIAALGTIVSKAVSAGGRLIKSLTLDPIMQGFREYETKMGAVQTILANTRAAGTKLSDVNAVLNDLNQYADKTIYNFSEMTRNIGTFTAAGVDLKTAASSIKGIANLAALSGSNSQQASTAMYQLSQAISAGRVSLQDWNSVVNAGMGGTIFQRALAQTAVHMGALDAGAVKLTGSMKNVTVNGQSFRESIMAKPGQQSWLTGKVLTETLSQLSGNLSDAELKAKGYSAAQIKAIQAQAKSALEAATQVKTLSQLLDTTKEAVGSGWAQTFEIILGNFGEAKTMFTAVSNYIGGIVSASASARNKMLQDWKSLGGRDLLFEGIKNAVADLSAVLKPIKEAFRDIFPAKTGQDLFDATKRFADFTAALKPSAETVENLHRTFRGLFAALDIGKQIVGGIFDVIGKLFGVVGSGSGGFLNLTGNIGDFIVKVDEALKKGGALRDFFDTLGNVLAAPLHILGQIGHAIGNMFTGFHGIDLGGLSGQFSPLAGAITLASSAWHKFLSSLSGANQILQPLFEGIGNFFSSLGDFIGNAVQNINWDTVLNTIKVGLLGGIFVLFRNFFKGANLADILQGGFLDKLTGPFDALTGQMKAMQTELKAKTLLEIAAAIGILAASLALLSTIDPKKLNSALSALAIGFAELLGSMKILTMISTNTGFLKVPIIASSMIILAAAIGILTLSIKALSGLDWAGLAKGLIGVGTMLAAISIASGPLSKNSGGMIAAGIGITAIAIAMKVLASAVADFGGLSWSELAKGLASVAISLGVIAAASRVFPSNMVAIGAGLVIIASGLKILASAITQLGGQNLGTLAKGIGAIGASLLVLAGAMRVMPKGMAAQAAGLVLVAVALQGIARAVGDLGGMSFGALAKGLVALGGSLGILAIGLKAMSGSVAGAAAMAIAAAGMRLLAPALIALGQQSWGEIVKGMVTLAAAMAVMGVAGIALGPVAPAILALGVALMAIGAALALAGAGIAGVGLGLSAIAVAGPTAIAILLKAIEGLVKEIPLAALKFAEGLVQFVVAIGKAAPQMVTAFANILTALLNAVIISAPKMAQAFSVLLQAGLKVLRDNFPTLLATGFQLLMQLLNGIKNHISEVTATVAQIVVRFLNSLASHLGQIVAAGANVLANLLQGIANNMGKVVTAAFNVIVNFLNSVANNLHRVINAGGNIIISIVTGIVNNFGRVVTAGVNAVVHFLDGVANNIGRVVHSGANVAISFMNAVANELPRLVDKGAEAVIRFLNGVASAIRAHSGEMFQAGANIGSAIVQGMISGVGSLAGALLSKVGGLIASLPKGAMKLLGIGSPSKVFADIGKNMILGLMVGLDNQAGYAASNMEKTIQRLINAVPDSSFDIEPIITPILDLSTIDADSRRLNEMLNVVPITAAASYGAAAAISVPVQGGSEEVAPTAGPSFKFEQNNYSPESLSPVEIYRQTKNQLSMARSALGV